MTASVDTALDQYRHDVALYTAPLTVACPSCYAVRGQHCKSSFGNRAPFHPRRKATIEGWTDAEKVAAVEQLRVDRHRALTTPTALTPQQAMVRAATSAAWNDGPEAA